MAQARHKKVFIVEIIVHTAVEADQLDPVLVAGQLRGAIERRIRRTDIPCAESVDREIVGIHFGRLVDIVIVTVSDGCLQRMAAEFARIVGL